MKVKFKLPATILALALFSTLNVQLSTAFAQGSLTPPGPPAATMLTLNQIEPRTPISSVPFTISSPGSYYLTTNLVCAVNGANIISINANGVTLDLNGFTLSSTVANAANGGAAIFLNSGLSDITICNGHIVGGVTNNGSGVYSGSGFAYGIEDSGNSPLNVLVSHVSVSGCLYGGIEVLNSDGSTLVESCTVRTVGGTGILAYMVKQSTALDCGGVGIWSYLVSDSQGQCTGGDQGIIANDSAVNCYGYSSGAAPGISSINVQNSYGFSASSDGIACNTALNCYGLSNSGSGIVVDNAENCFGYSSGGGYGVYAYDVANCCYGYSSSGTGLYALIASICHGAVGSGTPLSTSHNVNSY